MVNVILLVATYNHGRVLPTFFSYVYKLKLQPTKTIFAENNSTDNTLQRIKGFKLPKELIRLWFRRNACMVTENRYEVIAHVRQLLLTRARQLDPDYAIFLDSDVFPLDSLLIEKLTSHGLPIVGGPYQRVFPYGVFLASVWKGRWLCERMPSRLEEVELTSAGCLCLSRQVIQDRRVNFYPMYSETASEDFGFCRQAKKHGYKIWLDGTVKLKHFFKRRQRKPWTVDENNKYVPFYF